MSSLREQVMREVEERSFRAPESDFDDEKSSAFDALLDETVARGPGSLVAYDLPYPKHEFLCYLASRRGFLIHGSNNARIKVFEPRLQTDAAGRPSKRVYATFDGILPIYFAIVNRRRYRGSLRNWYRRRTENGVEQRYYFLSVNQRMLERGAWTKGTVYVLPPDTFEMTMDVAGEPTEEWSSSVEVVPVARIAVHPDDFPFLDRVEGHDDALAERVGELQLALVRSLRSVHEDPGRVRLRFVPRNGVRDDIEEIVATAEETGFLTDATFRVAHDELGASMSIEGAGVQDLSRLLRRYLPVIRIVRRIPGAFRLAIYLHRRR